MKMIVLHRNQRQPRVQILSISPEIDSPLRASSAELVQLAESVSETELVEAVRDADLLLISRCEIMISGDEI